MSDPRLMSDAELAELFRRADELDRGAYEHSLDHEDVAKILAHIDALAAELKRWQNAAYKATERADALSEQQLSDLLRADVRSLEAALDQARLRGVALELRAEQLRAALTIAIQDCAWTCAHDCRYCQAPFDESECKPFQALAALEVTL